MKCCKVKSSTHIQCKWQNILTKLPGVIGQARNATAPFETWCLITDEILDNSDRHINKCILINQPNVSHESDAKLTDKKSRVWKNCVVLTVKVMKNFAQ